MTDEATDIEKPDPTPGQAAKIAAAGAQAITKETDPKKAETAATEAIQAKADELGVKVTKEDVDMIASTVISHLESRGAFREEASSETTLDTTADEPGREDQEAEADHDSPDRVEAAVDTPPRKSSWAARYLKKGDD